MAKGEPFKKGRRLCCFCGSSGRSGEHFWPRWANRLLPNERYHGTVTGIRDKITGAKVRPGALKSMKITAVCKRCNSEWMSQLEIQVRPWLEPMINGDDVALSPAAQDVLARYFVMKVMVADQNRPEYEYFTDDELNAFYETRLVPPTMRVLLWRISVQRDNRVKGYLREALLPDAPGLDVSRNPASFTFVLGPVLVHVLSYRQGRFNFQNSSAFALSIFPPNSKTIIWPPPQILPIDRAEKLQMIFTSGRSTD